MNILIYNDKTYHNELIETVINKYHELLGISKEECKFDKLFISVVNEEESFIKYITDKYPKVVFLRPDDKHLDKIISCTIHRSDFNRVKDLDKDKYYFICHRHTKFYRNMVNVFYLTPLGHPQRYIEMDILPYSEMSLDNKKPVFLVIGNVRNRNWNLLVDIFKVKSLPSFKVKILTYCDFPKELDPYKDRIIYHRGLDFLQFHKECSECYCIMALLSKEDQPQYYSQKLTSTIAYTMAYRFKCILDQDLQDIYQLKNGVSYKKDIVPAFTKVLNKYYQKAS